MRGTRLIFKFFVKRWGEMFFMCALLPKQDSSAL